MNRGITKGRLVGLMVLAAAAAPVMAQSEPLLVVRGPGMKKVFTSPADAGMARAMGMLSQRLKEIPHEIQAFAGHPGAEEGMAVLTTVMPLIGGMIEHPCEIAIIDHGGMAGVLPNIDARITVQTGGAEVTGQMHAALQFIAQMAANEEGLTLAPEEGTKRMKLALPMGQVLFGPANEAGTAFVLGFDAAGDGLHLGGVDIPAPPEFTGLSLDGQLYVNVKSAANLLVRVMESHGQPQAEEIRQLIEQFSPEGDLDIVGASAIKGDRRWSVIRGRGMVTLLNNVAATYGAVIGMTEINTEPINVEAFRLIPQDVTMAGVQVQDLGGLVGVVQMAAFQLGLPELAGVVEALGKTWVSYMSDETGGGGLTSFVLVQPDVDAAAMRDSLAGLMNSLNLHAAPLHGYVRMRSWEAADAAGGAVKLHSLAFPGLPVPLEISLGVVDERLVMGVTPQGVLAAVDHWRSRRPTLADNPRFKEASAGLLANAQKVSFIDMPRTIHRGYPVAQMLGSAIANFVRSPVDQSRDPGVITPSMRTLSANAKAWIGVTSVQGGDFVYVSSGDPSLMVNVAGAAGSMGLTPALIGAGVAAAAIAEEHGHVLEEIR